MNKTSLGLIAALMLVVSVSQVLAVNSVIVPEVATLAENDVKVVDFCVSDAGSPLVGVAIAVEQVCKDLNGIVGCQVADDSATTQLSAVPLDAVTGADGCGEVQLTTTNANGKFYYSVSGSLAESQITEETATVNVVPEFGSLAAAGLLGAAGLLIYRKRK